MLAKFHDVAMHGVVRKLLTYTHQTHTSKSIIKASLQDDSFMRMGSSVQCSISFWSTLPVFISTNIPLPSIYQFRRTHHDMLGIFTSTEFKKQRNTPTRAPCGVPRVRLLTRSNVSFVNELVHRAGSSRWTIRAGSLPWEPLDSCLRAVYA